MAGVYIGRLNPIHRGHQRVINKMLEEHEEDHLLLVGSSTAPFSLRNYFSYAERSQFIRALYPNIRLVGLPDYPDDDDSWFAALDDIIRIAGYEPKYCEDHGGCQEDVLYLLQHQRMTKIISRFGIQAIRVSATEVRDALVHDREDDLKEMIDPRIIHQVTTLFKQKWEKFKKI